MPNRHIRKYKLKLRKDIVLAKFNNEVAVRSRREANYDYRDHGSTIVCRLTRWEVEMSKQLGMGFTICLVLQAIALMAFMANSYTATFPPFQDASPESREVYWTHFAFMIVSLPLSYFGFMAIKYESVDLLRGYVALTFIYVLANVFTLIHYFAFASANVRAAFRVESLLYLYMFVVVLLNILLILIGIVAERQKRLYGFVERIDSGDSLRSVTEVTIEVPPSLTGTMTTNETETDAVPCELPDKGESTAKDKEPKT